MTGEAVEPSEFLEAMQQAADILIGKLVPARASGAAARRRRRGDPGRGVEAVPARAGHAHAAADDDPA